MKKDKAFIIAVACVVLICIVFLAVVIFARPISASVVRSDVMELLESDGETVVLISDTRITGDMPFTNAERDIRAEDAKLIKQKLLEVLSHTKYKDSDLSEGNVWQRSVTVYVEQASVKIYLDEDSMILNGKDRTYSFEPKDTESYSELYSQIETLLTE